MRQRYVITFGRESSSAPLRLRFDARVLILAIVLLAGSPILFVLGATWGANAITAELLRRNAALEMENASYRDATTELVTEVATLQAAADDLGSRAAVDPEAARAMDRLPSSITQRAM